MRVRISRSASFALVALVAAGCLDQPTDPAQTTSIQLLIVSGDNQVAPAGQELPQPIVVKATDSNNQPMPNVLVNFVVTAGGGSVYAGAALTDANGLAADIWRLGPVPATPQTLEVRSVDSQGIKHVWGTFTATTAPYPATSIQKVQGDGQSALAGTAVPVAPAVKLLDQNGDPVVGSSVTFAVASGGGSITGASAVSDSQGIATVGSWTLGPTPGSNSLTATAADLPGSPVTFTATGTSAGSLSLTTPPSSSAVNGVALTVQPVIQLLDGQGAPLAQSGVTVTATVVEAGATASSATAVTDATGKATFSGLTITGQVGTYTLEFAAAGFAPVTSGPITLTAATGTGSLSLTTPPSSSAVNGVALTVQPVIQLLDGQGAPLAQSGVTVTATVVEAGATASSATAVTDATGKATFAGLAITGQVGTYTLEFTAAAFTPVTSGPITLTAATGSGSLSLTTPPSSSAVNGVALTVQPVIQLLDGQGAPLAQSGVTVTATVVEAGATASSATAVTDATGKATFAGLAITGQVGTYTLEFTAAAFTPVTSGPITLTAGPASVVAINGGDGQVANAGTLLPVAPSVRVTDQSGNPVAGVTVTFAVALGGGSLTAGSPVTDANGIAQVGGWTLGPLSGLNGLTATAAGVATPAAFSATALGDFWTNASADMKVPRRYTAYGVISGRLYVAGGRNSGGYAVTKLEVYNPASNTWASKASMLGVRGGAFSGVINGQLYVAGGTSGGSTTIGLNTVESYNPATNAWTSRAPLPATRSFGASAVVNNIWYVIGGDSNGSGITSTVFAYDPATDTWTQKAPLPAARSNAEATVVNGLIYVVGGDHAGGPTDGAVLVYDPATDSWSSRTPMPTPRVHLNVLEANGLIYALGGFVPGAGASSTVEVYDPVTDSWASRAPMLLNKVGAAVGFINGLLYSTGGYSGSTNLATTERYVP